MSAVILDGKKVAGEIKANIAQEIKTLNEEGIYPSLATVLVGNDPASMSYVNGKHRDCLEVGIKSIRVELEENTSQDELIEAIKELNDDPECTGYIVQLPLPKHIDTNEVLHAIDPKKDADGLHPVNLGKSVLSVSGHIDFPLSCTPYGILELLRRYNIDLNGKTVCVVGRGTTVGRALPALLTRKNINATVILTHTGTKDLSLHTKEADIVIAAAGVKHLIKPEDIQDGAIVLDVGVSRSFDEEKGKYVLYGDIDPRCYDKASFISPNPGGVGPMTRAMLLSNIVSIAKDYK